MSIVPSLSDVPLLQQNDPARTKFLIWLCDERSDADLAHALEQNPYVTDIRFFLNDEQRINWISLLQVIEMRANLEKVEVWDDDEEGKAPAALVRSILQAIQQNTAIRSVEMRWLLLPTDISRFVDTASSVTSFSLQSCAMEQGAGSDLAAALQRNTNIETLQLWKLDDLYAIPILEGLQSNTAVKTLNFSPTNFYLSAEMSLALQHLLDSTTLIHRFEWEEFTFSDEQQLFRPIAQGIINNESVSELKFFDVRFLGLSSLAQLQSILQNKQNLTSLCMHFCRFVGRQVHEDIISFLSQPDSLLRCFEFQSFFDSLDGDFPRIQFKNLLQAIQKSKLLERFSIGRIATPHQLQALTQSVPSMCIKELDVCFHEQLLRHNVNPSQNLLLAIKSNFSLRSVKARGVPGLFGTVEFKQRLAFYSNRNESLDQWVNTPETIDDRKVWPEALNLAQKAGPTALFQGLHSVLERDYVSLPGGGSSSSSVCSSTLNRECSVAERDG